MTLSVINSKLSRDLPPWSLQTILLEPYKEGGRHFSQVIAKTHLPHSPTLIQRVFHLVAAASLMIPIANLIVYIALRYFVQAPAAIQKDDPTCASSSLEAEERYKQAIRAIQGEIVSIPNINVRTAITDYVEFIKKSAHKLIDVQTDDKVIQLIYESVAGELENMTSQIREIPLEGLDVQPSSEALQWQQDVWQALQLSNPDEVKRVVRERQQFLNQHFYSWFGGTFFLHLAKVDRYIPYISLLKECGADPARQDFWGNTGLIWACANASNGMVRELLHVFGRGSYLDAQCFNRGNTALHLVVGKGYKDKSRDGVKLACSNLELLQRLIALQANVNCPNKDGNTPLHLAYLRRDSDMVRALLDAGANSELTNSKGLKPVDFLKASYAEASLIIGSTVSVFLLDRAEFEKNLSRFSMH